ncbi:stalk domain-containing protein [Paenibacillus sp. NEAU-GSW1]|uniref:stalk domain-containing protein n=1 Tax=Paenibacillus sp. NEAU-GSW1 TaxID=2682486 RepID=UPI0012E0D246|nr:stalk domain-containing protein [Paenibacillus sp. NEAU-GSW1]MUT65170.1 hypothetical protein [Paenibacillus sp. NEAU-GSW1]
MQKMTVRISGMLVLMLIVSVFSTLTATAATSTKRFDFKNGNYVTISNVVKAKKTEDVGYGDTTYVVQTPVTITFHGKLSDETQIAQWVDLEGLNLIEIKDNKAVLTETAEYGYGVFPVFQGEERGDNQPILLDVIKGSDSNSASNVKTVSAVPTDSKVLVNGKSVSFEAYQINNSNYFKLRDLAQAVNGTDKSFDVSWDAVNKAIALTSNKAYSSAGSDQASSGSQTNKKAKETTAKVMLNGKEVSVIAYEIDGSNYFKLRDVAEMMNIGVSWDSKSGTISIDTKKAYAK